jgi:hypothetical protein
MSNTNAMGFDDYGNEEADLYDQYATDMANDNYYKSQNSDFVKKVKCNNINSNFNGVESNIGTVDSLGGIGSESLQDDASANWLGNGERNNGNFDLDCINNNNNEGGQAPQTPGPTIIPSTSIYPTFGEFDTTLDDDPVPQLAQSIAICDEGDTVLSGSYEIQNPDLADNIEDRALASNTGWTVEATANAPNLNVLIRAIAQCFDNPPLNTFATADVSAFQQQSEDSPIISQGIADSPKLTTLEKQPAEDSPELTATEKITKLKQQWIELLP